MSVFEVAIGPGAGPGKFRVEVLNSPAGEAVSEVELDAAGLLSRHRDLADDVLFSASPASTVSAGEERIRQAGHELFTALLGTGDVANRYQAAAAVAADRDDGLRVVLRIGDPALAALPWEAMYDAAARRYVCRREQLVRRIGVPRSVPSLTVELPLRVLGIVSSPGGLPPLKVAREKTQLTQTFSRLAGEGRAELAWAASATWADLQDQLQSGPWHIVHFIGHGDFDAERDEGVLALTGDGGQADWVEASRFIDLLGIARPTPRLVVLNSCSGAVGSATDVFAGTAAALVRAGAGAVVAMQYEISDPAAQAFSRGFYGAIARGRGVDDATSAGRTAILGLSSRTLEWVTPVLYLRGSESRLFAVDREQPAPPRPIPAPTPAAGRPPAPGQASAGHQSAAEPELPQEPARSIATQAGRVSRLTFSPDGQLLASAHPGGAVRVWNTLTGECVASWTGRDAEVNSIAFSPAGSEIASGWSDGTVRLLEFDAARQPDVPAPDPATERPFTEAEIARLRLEIARLYSTASSAATLLRTVRYPRFAVPVWHTDALGFWVEIFAAIENGVMPDPDPFNRILDAARRTYTVNRELNALAEGLRPATAPGPGERAILQHEGTGPVTVALSPDGQRLASAGRHWLAVMTGLPDGQVERHELAGVGALAFRADSALLAAGRHYGSVRFYALDAAVDNPVRAEHGAAVTGLQFHPSLGLLAVVVAGGPARLQDLASGQVHMLGDGAARAAAFSPDGRLLAVAAGREVVFWDPRERARRTPSHALADEVLDVAFAPVTGLLAAACADGTITLWE